MLFELVEALAPHLPVRLEPGVQLDERLATDAVEATLTIGAYPNQTRITQDAQMFRGRRLADSQSLDEGVYRLFTGSQLVEDVAPGWLGDHLDRGIHRHEKSMPLWYIPVKTYTAYWEIAAGH